MCGTIQEFVASLAAPRRVLMMVPAGKAVDAVINDLRPNLAAGDLLIDGGNSYFEDTRRRIRALEGTGILYVGTGVSGGEEGALLGPAIMPGGNPEAWPLVKPIFQKIAAKASDGAPCAEWIGPDGAGHFVKMVHNGIEYGDMQMICEAYFLMERLLGLTPGRDAGRLRATGTRASCNSYLIEITVEDHGQAGPGDRQGARPRHPRHGRAEGDGEVDEHRLARPRRPGADDRHRRLRPDDERAEDRARGRREGPVGARPEVRGRPRRSSSR